ncbi:hypothetical protein V6N13_143144 [Hibiscus sabdariffa]
MYTASHAQSVQTAYANPQQVSEDRLHSGNRAPQAHYTVLRSDGVPSGNVVYYSAPITHHVPQLSSQNQFVPAIAHSTQSGSFPSPIGSHVASATPECGQLTQFLPTVDVVGPTMLPQASTPQALIATPEIVDDNAWYSESR